MRFAVGTGVGAAGAGGGGGRRAGAGRWLAGLRPLGVFALLAWAPQGEWLGAATVASGGDGHEAAGATVQGHSAVYLVLAVGDEGTIAPLFHRRVRLAALPGTVSEAEVAAARERAASGEGVLALELIAPGGEVVFRDVLRVVPELHGEFHGEELDGGGWAIEAVRIRLRERVVVVRVPAVPGGRLVIDGRRRFVLDLDELATIQEVLPLAAAVRRLAPRLLAPPPGDPANRADFLIMGDGYTAAQQADFEADADTLEADYFGITPYAEYKPFVNVARLFTPSAESGSDHPPYDPACTDSNVCCADPAMASDPLAGQMVDTALESQYCTAHIHRLLTADFGRVMAAASAVPDWDHILVLVNDGTYGGAGGSFAVASTHPLSVEVTQHEVGHSFTGLADEYECCNPGSSCSESTGSCAVNITNETNPGLIKWSPWILPTTPIPTPESDPLYTALVGLFEGALFTSTGVYRPRDNCLMRSLGVPFGEVCAQSYVLRLYEGGWGVPASGVDPIEPGSEMPAPGAVTADIAGVDFEVDLLQPAAAPALAARWSVDGVDVPGETGDQFYFPATSVGTFLVALEVEDPTPLVHPQMAGSAFRSDRQWSVQVVGRRLDLTLGGTGSGSVVSNPAGIDCGGDCTELYVKGSVVSLTPSPGPDSQFGGWGSDADCLDGSLTMTAHRSCEAVFDPLPTARLDVTRSGTGNGTVTSAPAGIDCGADCAEDYPQGAIVRLLGTPAAGSELTDWAGHADCEDGTLNMSGDRSCTAVFNLCSTQAEAHLANTMVTTGVQVAACNTVHIGPDLVVTSTGLVEALAGNTVVLHDGVEIRSGGELRAVVGSPMP